MNLYTTTIKAITPGTNKLTTYVGPHVPGISFEDAENYCKHNGLGYCEVTGKLIAEIPCDAETYEPNFAKMINYELPNLN